jgi:ABC-type branched-subunit amino acid transport system substrate-binding protein
MPMRLFSPGRRAFVRAAAAGACACALPAIGQTPKSAARNPVIGQIVDISALQQDVSRDFLVGSRAAWQQINLRGGLGGRPVQHAVVEVKGSAPELREALAQLSANASLLGLSGCVGDAAASSVAALLQADSAGIANVAPWLQRSSVAVPDQTFPIFAGHEHQIAYVVKSLASIGLKELGTVYASAQDRLTYGADVDRVAQDLKLRVVSFDARGEPRSVGQTLHASTPAVILFLGGTPELAQFTQGLERQSRQRYVVALAGVNIQTMLQMGGKQSTPVIATEVVPLVNAALPVVRDYREALARFFDEAPTSMGLAGYVAARYTHEVISAIAGPSTRASVLAEFQRRLTRDIGGFRVSFNASRWSSAFVTQSMTTSQGRLIG